MGVSENIFKRNYNIFVTLTEKEKKYFSQLKKYLYFCIEL